MASAKGGWGPREMPSEKTGEADAEAARKTLVCRGRGVRIQGTILGLRWTVGTYNKLMNHDTILTHIWDPCLHGSLDGIYCLCLDIVK